MDEDEDRPPRVPAPREGGHEYPAHPFVPAPRAAPAVECLPRTAGAVATITERPTGERVSSSALVRTDHRSAALAVRDDSVPSRLRAFGRDVARLVVQIVDATVEGVRALFEGLGNACPVTRRGLA